MAASRTDPPMALRGRNPKRLKAIAERLKGSPRSWPGPPPTPTIAGIRKIIITRRRPDHADRDRHHHVRADLVPATPAPTHGDWHAVAPVPVLRRNPPARQTVRRPCQSLRRWQTGPVLSPASGPRPATEALPTRSGDLTLVPTIRESEIDLADASMKENLYDLDH